MKAAVEPGAFGGVVKGRLGLVEMVAQGGDFGVAGVFSGQAGGQPLQLHAHHVELNHLTAVEAGDGHPGPWGRLHQTVGLQAFQRLAHRRSADPQPGGDLGLAQTVAGTQSALANGLANLIQNHLPARR